MEEIYQVGEELQERLECGACRLELERTLHRYRPEAELPLNGAGGFCAGHRVEVEEAMARHLPSRN